MTREQLERNLRLYPAYQVCRHLLFWVPVFFLYFSARLPAADVLRLEAFYYLAVVVLEVPSGYLSDRLGRRPTLLLAMAGWGGGAALIAASDGFWALAAGQALLAVGMSFNSGTDSALLYESLVALGRGHEIGQREATAMRLGLFATSGAALLGGLLATSDLRWPYVLTALGGAAALTVATRFAEPSRAGPRASAPVAQVGRVARSLRDPVLAWVLAIYVGMVVFQHVPYELFQPWLAVVLGEAAEWTPLASGLAVCATTAVAAMATGVGPRVVDRVGVAPAMLGVVAAQAAIITALGLWVAPAAVVLLAVRSAPAAMLVPINRAAVHPRVDSGVRATWLSVQSLLGRLAFAGWLTLAAADVGELASLGGPALASLLLDVAIAAGGLALVLGVGVLAIGHERFRK